MKHKLLNLQKATQCLNVAAGLIPATPASTSLAENIDHKASEYKHQLQQQDLEMKILSGRNVAMKHKLLKLRKATQCLNAAAGLVPATSSASLGENIDPSASECKHELKQKNLEVKILREGPGAMKRKLLKLQKATESINTAAGLIPATSPLSSLGDNINHNASEYEQQLEQQNLKMKILRERNVAMKHKLLKLQKATECVNEAAGLLPVMTSAALDENMDPIASEYKHELEQKNLEVKILREKHGAMKRKLLKLQKATEFINTAAGLIPAMPALISLNNNIDHNASEYEQQLEQQNLKMKILRGRNVAMKYKLLKLQKATERVNAAAGLLPIMTSAALDENMDPIASEYKHELEQKNLEVKILRGRNVAMKHKLLNLQKATQCLNVAAGLIPATPASTSLAEYIDHKASEYKHQLQQQDLEMKILSGRNVAMKHKLLKLQKATQCLNAAAGLVPAMSSASLGENMDPIASECKHELKQKNLEVKILREGPGAMKRKLLKLQKATESINTAAGLIPATSPLSSLGDNINHNASEYEQQLEQQNLKMKILRERNVAMKHKLLKLQKATECVNEAAGLLPVMTSAALDENMDPIASEYKHELEQKNLEVKILRGRNVAMKHKLLNLQKATQCLNEAAGLIPATPASTSLAENINHKTSEYKTQLKQQDLEMRILSGRNIAMKHKLLKLLKATQCLNVAAGLLTATSSTSLGENMDPNVSEYKYQLIEKNLEMKVLRERHTVMKYKLFKLQKATESKDAAADLVPPMPASISLGDNVDPNAFDHHQLELKNISHHASSIYQHLPEPNDLVDLLKSIFNIF
ncbi:rho-associated protein kinase 1-like isoform X2 [Phyllostomus discolor]|uniref:Rho-associated protein kinase 1-like isoform X1 n=1 Tax=Phyllostomus discolor TaxID=89673 RepID=A0A7E6DVB9_9CHIR|nr:rho-associated protein kinase 1-like isoform X1 [Phyllostomus discolor]XP_035882843.1 rho-associated protein kinase 1-like isoform X2 [Phyllostomus discolor]